MDPQLTSTIIDRDALLDCSSHGVTCLALEKINFTQCHAHAYKINIILTHTRISNRYMTLIGVHEMHSRVHPN